MKNAYAPVYYEDKKYNSASEASIELDVSLGTLYTALAAGILHGKAISRRPFITDTVHFVSHKEHKHGEPLTPHPVTCMISSEWRG